MVEPSSAAALTKRFRRRRAKRPQVNSGQPDDRRAIHLGGRSGRDAACIDAIQLEKRPDRGVTAGRFALMARCGVCRASRLLLKVRFAGRVALPLCHDAANLGYDVVRSPSLRGTRCS